jgi:hypothetical protein
MAYKRHLSTGRGYVWTQVLPKRTILNTDINEWKADDHTPALYAKTIVDKIFATKGYKYTDDSFFTSDRFKRLIVPFAQYQQNIHFTLYQILRLPQQHHYLQA